MYIEVSNRTLSSQLENEINKNISNTLSKLINPVSASSSSSYSSCSSSLTNIFIENSTSKSSITQPALSIQRLNTVNT